MKNLNDIHKRIADDVYPNGLQGKCSKCGKPFSYTKEECVDYLAHGWPKCDHSCQWELLDDMENIWRPSCDEFELWHFEDGGPEDNHVRFCPFCGRTLIIKEEVEQ